VRVIVTGSRDWTDAAPIYTSLNNLLTPDGWLIVVHGAAHNGGDAIADAWCREHIRLGHTVGVERHPANWRLHGRRRAGIIRNVEMVQAGADLCLAFLRPCALLTCRRPEPHFSHGTSHCADYAEKAGIETRRFRWENR
jgi:hypothetical protein